MINKNRGKAPQSNCETCVYFDYDEEWDDQVCTYSLDEDEMEKRAAGHYKDCPYYKFYDEYKSVNKQI